MCNKLSDNTGWTRIQYNSSWIGPLIESKLPGNKMILDGEIKIATEKCCPIIFLAHHTMGLPLEDGCLDLPLKHLNNFPPFIDTRIILLDWKIIRADKYITCKLHEDKNYTCHFYGMQDTMAMSGIGKVYIFYPCEQRKPLDIPIDLRLKAQNISNDDVHCSLLNTNSTCMKYYNYSALPNMFGLYRRRENYQFIAAFRNVFIATNCHKHAEEFLCYAFLPECTGHHRILPCKSTCREVFGACWQKVAWHDGPYKQILEYFSIYESLEVLLEVLSTLFCNELPYADDCFETEPVTCPVPASIEHGSHNSTAASHPGHSIIRYPVHSSVDYQCNSGYKLNGNGTVHCEYSGNWSSSPKCITRTNDKDLIIICSVLGAIIVLIVVIGFICWKYRKKISAILYVKYGIKFIQEKEENRTYDAFIAYSQEDIGFVKHNLLVPLEKIPYKICIPERDFESRDYKSQNIIKSVQESRRTIIVLSQNFIDSGWCQFEFAQSHLKLLEDESFKLLLIVTEEPRLLHRVPKVIDNYIKTRTYLRYI